MNITTKQYSEAKGVPMSTITWKIRNGIALQDVIRYNKIGRDYVLEVKKDFNLKK